VASVKPQTGQPEVVDDSASEQESKVTTPADLGFGKHTEIEVQPLHEPPAQVDADGMVEIRMARTIEEFTYGNPHIFYRLEEGKRYKVPANIARYLASLGCLYLRS
jgi:hypothetical protein